MRTERIRTNFVVDRRRGNRSPFAKGYDSRFFSSLEGNMKRKEKAERENAEW